MHIAAHNSIPVPAPTTPESVIAVASVIPPASLPSACPKEIAPLAHEAWMRRALALADQAATLGEVPVVALIVFEDEIVAEAFNSKEASCNALAHAELLAIEQASRRLGRWRLAGCTLYVTLEPCVMCAGAIVQARPDRIVYATSDRKAGGVESLYQILADTRLNHQPDVLGGVLAEEAAAQLSGFFRHLREQRKRDPATQPMT